MPSNSHRAITTDGDGPRDVRALIMKGGGIKGLAYVGALEELERRYRFNWFIGTSAGAIAAVLLGAGFTTDELKEILKNKDFKDFFDASWYQKPLNLLFHHGIHRADSFTDWLDGLLASKLNSHARVRLSQLPKRVTVYASQRGYSALSFDSRDHDADAAFAARCSMSIPWVFTPQLNQGLRAYDGGIQNNYPVKNLKEDHPQAQFISLYLGSEIYEPPDSKSVLIDLISIASEGSDPEMITKYRDSTVIIDPRPISTLDFSLTPGDKELLLLAGRVGALKHLSPDADDCKSAIEDLKILRAKVTPAYKTKCRRKKALKFVKGFAMLAICAAMPLGVRFVDGNPSTNPNFVEPSNVKETVLFTVIDDATDDPIHRQPSVDYRLKGELNLRSDVEKSHRGHFRIPGKAEDIEELNVAVNGYLMAAKWNPSNPDTTIRLQRDETLLETHTAFALSIKPDLDTVSKPSPDEYRKAIETQNSKRNARFSIVNHSSAAVTPVVIPWMPEESELDGFAMMVLPPCHDDGEGRNYNWPFPSRGAYFFVFLSVYGQRAQLLEEGNLQGDKELTIVVTRVDESDATNVDIKGVVEWQFPK